MFETYEAANLEEAVGVATRFQQEGRYNWFRGQVRDWPPYSSLFRIRSDKNTELEERALRRLTMFLNWVERIPELRQLLRDPDAAFAVAQHYGIPTNHIDFTTVPGVAGFFATDSPTLPKEGIKGCIYCLNTKELLEVWEDMRPFRPKAHLQLVTIDVSNLWRLEAQHGCFLWCDYNWDVDYPMDRILFPQSGYPSWPTKEDIYPRQKSPLELMLDQYLDIEQTTFGGEQLRQLLEDAKANGNQNILIHDLETPKDFYEPEAVKTSELPMLKSWSPLLLKDWTRIEVERMDRTISAPVTLQFKATGSPKELASSVTYGVRQVLKTRRNPRQSIFDWELRGLTAPEPLTLNKLCEALQAIWNGMRSLPYSDDEIATACGIATHLFLERFSLAGSPALAQLVLGDCFQVEFAAIDGSGSRGYITRASLQSALRSDLSQFASDQLTEAMHKDVRRVLQAIFSPSRLIEFDQLRVIFANELIPTQVLTRELVLYSPRASPHVRAPIILSQLRNHSSRSGDCGGFRAENCVAERSGNPSGSLKGGQFVLGPTTFWTYRQNKLLVFRNIASRMGS